jgi:hypothetical protein
LSKPGSLYSAENKEKMLLQKRYSLLMQKQILNLVKDGKGVHNMIIMRLLDNISGNIEGMQADLVIRISK